MKGGREGKGLHKQTAGVHPDVFEEKEKQPGSHLLLSPKGGMGLTGETKGKNGTGREAPQPQTGACYFEKTMPLHKRNLKE